MVYQGIIETAKNGGGLWVIWLIAAMFGSALTLASFMKLVHTVFLGQRSVEARDVGEKVRETGPTMWIPTVILASLCVVFGIFAYGVPLKMFIYPSLGAEAPFTGVWSSGLATGLLLLGIIIGYMLYLVGGAIKTRTAEVFVGGEDLRANPEMRVSGTEFYETIRELGVLRTIYIWAEKKYFDIYEIGARLTLGFNKVLRYIHNGILLTYLAWCMLGMIVLFYFLLRNP
jgi:NADH:ubiquinone oxidoreductase subunit 5 (subunit L)/multisubunit Na+/H+ antiporter MnhA subunit